MKKNSILKAITITFLVYVLASWIIPAGKFANGAFTKGETSPVGIGDLFIFPISTFVTSIFVLTALIILLIGALYGVMNKTGVYGNLVEGVAKKFKGSEKSFLIISVITFAVLSSLTSLTLPLLVLVPFAVAVILTLGFNKMTALLSTVGAILVGNIGTTFGYNTGGYNYVNYFFGLKSTENILWKVVLLVALTAVLVVYIVKTSKIEKAKKSTKKTTKKAKEETKAEEVVIPLYKGETAKKNTLPLVIIVSLGFVIAMVAMFNWAGALGVQKTIFDTWHTNITNVKLNNYPIFANILGSLNAFGYWSNYEFAMILVVVILVLGLVYKLKIDEIIDAAVEGMKEMLPVAVVAMFANILLLVVNSATGTFFTTIFNSLLSATKGFNFATLSLTTLVGSIGYSDFPYLMNALYDPMNSLYYDSLPKVVYVLQAMYGFAMLIVPTSVGLVVGLKFVGVSYKDWFKENWKLLLSLFAVTLVMVIIVTLV